jgi:S-disulfanyl-L-cysteine oxidoreductase SoxD
MKSRFAVTAIVAAVVLGGLAAALRAQATRTVWDGVYTEEQATRGGVLFDRECAQCHGPAGAGGGMAPALVDSAFSANYDGQTVGDLFDRNRSTMPIGREGQLSGQQNADITAFMLQCNKFPSGTTELPSQSLALRQIQYVAQQPGGPSQGNRPSEP